MSHTYVCVAWSHQGVTDDYSVRVSISLYLYCKIASWEDHKKKKHSIFLALILVPKNTPSALLVWSNMKSD